MNQFKIYSKPFGNSSNRLYLRTGSKSASISKKKLHAIASEFAARDNFMPSTRDIRRRIKSVKNTAQITKAMQMVASSKMRKAQLAALAGRPYAVLMNEVMANVALDATDFTHPLMEARPVKKRCVVVVSTDKGLCGA